MLHGVCPIVSWLFSCRTPGDGRANEGLFDRMSVWTREIFSMDRHVPFFASFLVSITRKLFPVQLLWSRFFNISYIYLILLREFIMRKVFCDNDWTFLFIFNVIRLEKNARLFSDCWILFFVFKDWLHFSVKFFLIHLKILLYTVNISEPRITEQNFKA